MVAEILENYNLIGCRKLEKNNLIGCWIIRKNNLVGCRMIRKNEFDCLRNIRKRGSERNCRNNRNWRDWFQEYYYVIGCRNIRKRMRLVAGTSAWFREGRREARTRSSPTLHCRQVRRNNVVVVVYSVTDPDGSAFFSAILDTIELTYCISKK